MTGNAKKSVIPKDQDDVLKCLLANSADRANNLDTICSCHRGGKKPENIHI